MNAKICLLSLAALAAVPAAASAQSVTTNCYWGKHTSRCTSTLYGWPDYGETRDRRSKKQRQADDQQRREYEAGLLAKQIAGRDPRTQDAEFQRWRVSESIRTGDCPGAHRYAAQTTNPAIIQRAVDFCGKP